MHVTAMGLLLSSAQLRYNPTPRGAAMMANDAVYSLGAMWATKIADAYAAEARPHFSAATKEKFRQRLEEEVVSLLIISKPSADWPDTINDFLDEEEKSRLRCVGPRLLGVNEDSGEVRVGPRPELDR